MRLSESAWAHGVEKGLLIPEEDVLALAETKASDTMASGFKKRGSEAVRPQVAKRGSTTNGWRTFPESAR